MEIKVGMIEMTWDYLKTAHDYNNCVKTITKALFRMSGIEQKEVDIVAMAENLHRFLVENPDFVVGIVNAGKIKL